MERLFHADAKILVADFSESAFLAIATLGAEEVKALLQSASRTGCWISPSPAPRTESFNQNLY
jgi:hypothetical protein